MKPAEIRELPTEEMRRELDKKRRELFNLRFQHATEQMERPAELRKIRKDIARMLTVLNERARAEGRPQPAAAETRSDK